MNERCEEGIGGHVKSRDAKPQTLFGSAKVWVGSQRHETSNKCKNLETSPNS